jgi:hypothetical protein
MYTASQLNDNCSNVYTLQNSTTENGQGHHSFRKDNSSLSIYELRKKHSLCTMFYYRQSYHKVCYCVLILSAPRVVYNLKKKKDFPKLYVPWDKRIGSTQGALYLQSWNVPIESRIPKLWFLMFYSDLSRLFSVRSRNNSAPTKGTLTLKEKLDKGLEGRMRKEEAVVHFKVSYWYFCGDKGRKIEVAHYGSPPYVCDPPNALPEPNASSQLSASSSRG